MTAAVPNSGRPFTPRRRASTWVALALLVAALGMVAFMLVANASPDTARLPYRGGGNAEVATVAVTVLAWLSMLGTGTVLAILRPRNAIGWLLLLGGLTTVFTYFGEDYVARAVVLGWPLPGYRAVSWVLPVPATLSSVLIAVWVPLLFPTGSLPGRRWRPVAWVIGLVIVADIVIRLFTDDYGQEYGRSLPNPLAIGGDAGALAQSMIGLTSIVLVASILLSFASLVIRYVRATGVERAQFKWFLAAVSLVFATLIAMSLSFALDTRTTELSYTANQVAVGLPPIAIAIAILRYRLFEIDRLISRTISWTLVTVLLVGTFAVAVLALQAALAGLTQGETLAVAASTLVAFALFAPVRSRVQRAVDRRFDRARFDGERLLGQFGERLRDEVDREAIRADVLGTVDAAVRPSSAGLWLRAGAADR